MNGYYVALLIACAILFPSVTRETKNLHILSLFIAATLVFIVAFRADTTDYGSYFGHFASISQSADIFEAFTRYRDGGHGVIIYSLSLISSSPLIYFLFYASFSIGLTYYVYSKSAVYALFPWFVFITNGTLHQNMAQMRQGLVTSIFLFSLYLLYKKRRSLWALLAAASSTIHASAITTFIAPALRYIASGPILYSVLGFSAFASLAGGIGSLVGSPLIPHIDGLLGGVQHRYDRLEPITLTLHFVHVGFLFSLLFVYFRHHIKRISPFAYFLVPVHAAGAAFEVAFRDTGRIGGRVGDLFTYGTEPIIWAALIAASPKSYRLPIVLVIGFWFIFKFVNTNFVGDVSSYTLFFFSDYYNK